MTMGDWTTVGGMHIITTGGANALDRLRNLSQAGRIGT